MWPFNSHSRRICSPIDLCSVRKEPLHSGFCQFERVTVQGNTCSDHRAPCSGCLQGTAVLHACWLVTPEKSLDPVTQVATRASCTSRNPLDNFHPCQTITLLLVYTDSLLWLCSGCPSLCVQAVCQCGIWVGYFHVCRCEVWVLFPLLPGVWSLWECTQQDWVCGHIHLFLFSFLIFPLSSVF